MYKTHTFRELGFRANSRSNDEKCGVTLRARRSFTFSRLGGIENVSFEFFACKR